MNTVEVMRSNKPLAKPAFIRLNTVGDVVCTLIALKLNAMAAEQHDHDDIAAKTRALAEQLIDAVGGEDWDCGDPDCKTCSEGRGGRPSVEIEGEERHREPSVMFVLNGGKAGDA